VVDELPVRLKAPPAYAAALVVKFPVKVLLRMMGLCMSWT
jgi:hypothetical protein